MANCVNSKHGLGGSVSKVSVKGLVRELITDGIKGVIGNTMNQSEL